MAEFYTDWSVAYDPNYGRNYNIRFKCVYSESNVVVGTNKSTVNCSVYADCDPDTANRGIRNMYLTIDGTSYGLITSTTRPSHGQLIGTRSKEITHDSDGSKKITMSMSFVATNSSATLYGGPQSFTLTTIPRASTVTVSPRVVETTATPLNIAVDLKSTSFTHTVKWRVDKGDTSWNTLATKVQTTSFTVPYNDIKAKVGVYTAATIEVEVETFNGNTSIGTNTALTQYINMTKLPLSLYDDLEGDVGASIGAEANEGGFNVYLDTKFKLPNDITLSDTLQDYVIAQGIENGFTYRKWASGISECWRLYSFRSSFGLWVSGVYESSAQGPFNYPTGLFIEKPVFSANVIAYSGLQGVELWNNTGDEVFSKDHTGLIYALSPRELTNLEVDLHMKAIGRWK